MSQRDLDDVLHDHVAAGLTYTVVRGGDSEATTVGPLTPDQHCCVIPFWSPARDVEVVALVPYGCHVDQHETLRDIVGFPVEKRYPDNEVHPIETLAFGLLPFSMSPFVFRRSARFLIDPALAEQQQVIVNERSVGAAVVMSGARLVERFGAEITNGLALPIGEIPTPTTITLLMDRANDGDPAAMFDFATRRLELTPDDDEAQRWIERASDLGNIEAMHRMELRAKAAGDEAEERRWLERQTDLGNPRAAGVLGCRLYGEDEMERAAAALVRSDTTIAHHWSRLAWIRKRQDRIDDGTNDCQAAWLRVGADSGDADAMNSLGVIRYYQDRRDDDDPDGAVHWYLRAFEAGSERGAGNIGEVREEQGRIDGPDGAIEWYRRGVAAGSDFAREGLERLGVPVTSDAPDQPEP